MSNYTITSNNNSLNIHCANKLMLKNLDVEFKGPIIKKDYLIKEPSFNMLDLQNVPKRLSYPFDFIFYASNNIDIYGSYKDSTKPGIYHINTITKEITQIYTEYYSWQYFFEDSKGNIYVSTDYIISSSPGIIHLQGAKATHLENTSGYNHTFFEDSKDNTYACGDCYGVYYLNGTNVTNFGEGNDYTNFFEDSKGNAYAYSSIENNYLLHLNGSLTTRVKLESNYYPQEIRIQTIFETKNGGVFINTGTSGLYKLDGATYKSFDTSGSQGIFEDSNGVVYFCGPYIYSYYKNTLKQIYSEVLSTDMSMFEAPNGNVYASFQHSSYPGIILLTKDSATFIESDGYDFIYLGSSNQDDIYLSSKNVNNIWHLKDTTITKVISSVYNPKVFKSINNDNVYIIETGLSSIDIYSLKGSVATNMTLNFTNIDFNHIIEDSKGNIYVSAKEFDTGIFYIKDSTIKQVYAKGVAWEYSLETKEGLYLFTSKNLSNTDTPCVLAKDGVIYEVYLSELKEN
jgi:hypothetical protein